MHKIIGVVLLLSQGVFCQDYYSEFLLSCQTNDTINQLEILTQWEIESPQDAELFVSYFNYHFIKSRQEVLSLSTNKLDSDENLILKDSLGETAGYLGSQIRYDEAELKKGLDKIDEGISLYPNRLDMRFGKIYVFGQIPDWERFTAEIIKTIQYSSINNNNWTWENDDEEYGGKDDFLLDIQSYQLQLYNTRNDYLLKNMREIAEEVIKYYPNHVPSLSNISTTYVLAGKYDKAIEVLLQAEKIDCLLYTSPSPRDLSTSRMPSSA